MAKFRVLSGRHYEGDVLYEQDSIVESDRDLVAAFGMEKFAEVVEAAPQKAVEETPESEKTEEEEEPAKAEKKKVNLKRKS